MRLPDYPLRDCPTTPCSHVQMEEMVFNSVHNLTPSTYTIALSSTTTQHYYVHYKVQYDNFRSSKTELIKCTTHRLLSQNLYITFFCLRSGDAPEKMIVNQGQSNIWRPAASASNQGREVCRHPRDPATPIWSSHGTKRGIVLISIRSHCALYNSTSMHLVPLHYDWHSQVCPTFHSTQSNSWVSQRSLQIAATSTMQFT